MAPFHLSSLLRWISLLVLVSVTVLIVISFRVPPPDDSVSIPVETSGMAPPASPSTPNEPAAPIDPPVAAPEDVVEETIGFEAEGVRDGTRSFLLRADRTLTRREEVMDLEGVELLLFQGPGAGLRIESREGTYRAGDEQVDLRGAVRVWRDGVRLIATERLSYRPNPDRIRAPGAVSFATRDIVGTGFGIDFLPDREVLVIDGPVRFRYLGAGGPAEPIDGRCWQLTYRGVAGEAELVGDAALYHSGAALHGWRMVLRRPAPGEPSSRLEAFRAVTYRGRPGDPGTIGVAHADHLTAWLQSGGTLKIDALEMAGAVRGDDGRRRGRADTVHYRGADRYGVLLGTAAGRAELHTPGRGVKADRIEVWGEQQLSAAGNVETVLPPGPERSGAFPFATAETISVLSGRLDTDPDGTTARFGDGVVAWQGDRQIAAGRLEVKSDALRAGDEVVTRFPLEGEADGSRQHVTLRADRMRYDRNAGRAHYEGNARMDRGEAATTSRRIVIEMGDGEGGKVRQVQLEEEVRLRMGDRTGVADHGLYLPAQDQLILMRDEGFVELYDPIEGRSLHSRRLTLNLSGDSMTAETGNQGRLEMTLTPGRGDRNAIDANAGD